MSLLKSKKVPGLKAKSGPDDTLGNASWLVSYNNACYTVENTKNNRSAARKRMQRLETIILDQPKMPNVETKMPEPKPEVKKYAPQKLHSLVQSLYAKQTNEEGAWAIFYKSTVLRVIDNTQDNREAARRGLRHLEFKTDAALEQLRKIKKASGLKLPAAKIVVNDVAATQPKPAVKLRKSAIVLAKKSVNTKVIAQIRISGPEGIDAKVFDFGEFVHHANARSRFDKLCAALNALAETYK